MRTGGAVLLVLLGCALEERADFLVGRACRPGNEACDEGQVCLPHDFVGSEAADFRCRDAASVESAGGAEPPRAYCAPEAGLACPRGTVCGAGRIRRDSGPRRRVCRPADAAFGPPPAQDGGL